MGYDLYVSNISISKSYNLILCNDFVTCNFFLAKFKKSKEKTK